MTLPLVLFIAALSFGVAMFVWGVICGQRMSAQAYDPLVDRLLVLLEGVAKNKRHQENSCL